MIKRALLALIALGTVTLTSPAQVTMNWTFTEEGGFQAGSGTLIVSPDLTTTDGYDGYQITDFSGIYLGYTITGLGPLSGVGLGGSDDLLAQLDGNLNNSYLNDQLDYDGITFTYDLGGETQYEKFRSVPYRVFSQLDYPDLDVARGNAGTFSASINVVPEPSSIALSIVGLGGLFCLHRKK